MNKWLKKFFGYELVKSEKVPELGRAAEAIVERDDLKKENDRLRRDLDAAVAKYPIVSMDVGDPSPKDKEERKLYVAAIAGFHKDYLKPKIQQMISTTHSLLKDMQNERELDLVLKGTVYSLEELDKWGDSMISEQVSNQIGQNPASEND